MNEVQQRAAAKHFAEYWKGKGYEKGESQKFWLSLLTDVFGVEHAAEYIMFEDQVHLDHTSCMTDTTAYSNLEKHIEFIRYSDLSDGDCCHDIIMDKRKIRS